MKIEMLFYGNFLLYDSNDNLILRVKRTFKWNSLIYLEFYKEDKLVLKTSHYTFFPFKSEKIHFQNLGEKISIKKKGGKQILIFKDNELFVKNTAPIFLKKNICEIYINKILVGRGIIQNLFSLKDINIDFLSGKKITYEQEFFCLIFLAINFSDIDSN